MENGIKSYLKDVRLMNNPTLIARMDAAKALRDVQIHPVTVEPLGSLAQLMLEEFRNDVSNDAWLVGSINSENK